MTPDVREAFDAFLPLLRRRPDIEAHDLVAADASDRLILASSGLIEPIEHHAPPGERPRSLRGAPPGANISAPNGQHARAVVVVGDRYGGLTLPLAAVGFDVRVHQDRLTGERAARLNAVEVGLADAPNGAGDGLADGAAADRIAVPGVAWHGLEPMLVEGARVVLMQLPRSLDALDEVAALIAERADPDVVLLAGGRVKHMTPAMNDVLARHFAVVTADRGVGKSRVLRASVPRADAAGDTAARGVRASTGAEHASRGGEAADRTNDSGCKTAERRPRAASTAGTRPRDPRPAADERNPARWPRSRRDPETGLVVCAHGAAFAGTSVDIGTRLLLSVLGEAPAAQRAIDLGCGTGVIATSYAIAHPDARVVASDPSSAAVASACATAAANRVLAATEGASGVVALRDDALRSQPDASADLVLVNPPFHSGAAVTDQIAPRLFADAARVLRPGGELWCVWNSHLRYRAHLERLVGQTRQVARNAKFTVTASTAR